MKPYLLIAVCTISCLLILLFIFFPNRNLVKPIGEQFPFPNHDKILIEWNQMIETYLTFPLDAQYGSHAIVLLAAVYVSKSGPVLELGMGGTSSPLLHRLAKDQKRFLLSADSDIRWINYFSSFTANNSLHKLKYIEVKTHMGIEWASAFLMDSENWTVVFIDHAPGPRRQFDLMLYSHRSHIVVLHDTESSGLYKYGPGLSYYPYQYRFTKFDTYTDVLSSKHEKLIKQVRYLLDSTPEKYFSSTYSKEKL